MAAAAAGRSSRESSDGRNIVRLRVDVDGLSLTSAVPVRDRPVVRLVESMNSNGALKGQVQELWTTRRGRAAWVLLVDMVVSLSRQRLPRYVRQGFYRKVFVLMAVHFFLVFVLAQATATLHVFYRAFVLQRPLLVLILSALPQCSVALMDTKTVRSEDALCYLSLAFHTLVVGIVWGMLDKLLAKKVVTHLIILMGTEAASAAVVLNHWDVTPAVALVFGWFAGVIVDFQVSRWLGNSLASAETAAALVVACLSDFCWRHRETFRSCNPDKVFETLTTALKGPLCSLHFWVSATILADQCRLLCMQTYFYR